MSPIKIAVLCSIIMLGACTQSSHPMGKPLPELSYDSLVPYKPYGGAVEVHQTAVLDEQTQKALKTFVVAPDKLIQDYANHRFVIADQMNEVAAKSVFNVQVLSLHQETLGHDLVNKIIGTEDHYTFNVLITLTPLNSDGNYDKPSTIRIKRELTIPEYTTLAEKEFRQFEFMENVIQDIDRVVSEFMVAIG